MMPNTALQNAINRLADKIENGHLLADFVPADFINAVIARIEAADAHTQLALDELKTINYQIEELTVENVSLQNELAALQAERDQCIEKYKFLADQVSKATSDRIKNEFTLGEKIAALQAEVEQAWLLAISASAIWALVWLLL